MKKITNILLAVLLSTIFSGQQLAANQPVPGKPHLSMTPEGALYNNRTHDYDPRFGVYLRSEFRGMRKSDRVDSVRGNPDTTGKVYYTGNQALGLGGPRWVTPGQLGKLHDREEELRLRNKRINAIAAATRDVWNAATNSRSGSNWTVAHPGNNSEELKELIIGATVLIEQSDGYMGSGVITIILGKKYVLTANHVIKDSRFARLTSLKDQSFGFADSTGGWHDRFDIAAIPLPRAMQHLPAVPLFRGKFSPGQPVFLSGFPGGIYHLTPGFITGYRNGGTEMLHTARSEKGASGGMLITPDGQLCGIHTATYLPGSPLYPNNTGTPSSLILHLVDIHGR